MSNSDIVDQFEPEKKAYDRTIFLTITCIASFIGSWLTILYYALYINKVNDIERSVYHLDEGGILEYKLMKISIAAAFVSFVGSVFMWRLKRYGLFIYGLGQTVPAAMIVYIALLVNPIETPKTFFMLGYAGLHVVFIGLYAINWKSMSWK